MIALAAHPLAGRPLPGPMVPIVMMSGYLQRLNPGNDKDTGVLSGSASNKTYQSDYAGGSVEVKNGQIAMEEEKLK